MKALKKFLIEIYATLFLKSKKVKWPDKSREEFNRNMRDFSERINSFPYKSDPIGGLIDYIDHPDNFFKEDKTEGRDCDDWARMWSIWGALNGYKAQEWVVCNPKKMFSTMHAITTLEKDGSYYLMNYYFYGPYDSEESALAMMSNFTSYVDDIIIIKAKEVSK